MERTTEGTHQKRAFEMFQMVTQTAPMIPQMPFVDWESVFKKVGDAINVPELSSLIDYDMARQMAQMGEATAEGQKPDPARLAKDLGEAGKAGKARPKITEAEKGGIVGRAQMENMMGQQTGTEAQRLFQGGM